MGEFVRGLFLASEARVRKKNWVVGKIRSVRVPDALKSTVPDIETRMEWSQILLGKHDHPHQDPPPTSKSVIRGKTFEIVYL